MVTRKVIEQVKLGIYTVSNKERYKPTLSREFVRLSKIVVKEYSELEYCIWSTEWFNDFTRHQLGTFIFVIEVEKDFMEEVFMSVCMAITSVKSASYRSPMISM